MRVPTNLRAIGAWFLARDLFWIRAIAAWWRARDPFWREIMRAWMVTCFACLLASVALRYGGPWVIGGIVAGAFGALAVRDAFVLALERLRPASKAHRRLASRVESAVNEHALAQAASPSQDGAA